MSIVKIVSLNCGRAVEHWQSCQKTWRRCDKPDMTIFRLLKLLSLWTYRIEKNLMRRISSTVDKLYVYSDRCRFIHLQRNTLVHVCIKKSTASFRKPDFLKWTGNPHLVDPVLANWPISAPETGESPRGEGHKMFSENENPFLSCFIIWWIITLEMYHIIFSRVI